MPAPKIPRIFLAPDRQQSPALPVRALNALLVALVIGGTIFVTMRHAALQWRWDLVAKYWRLFRDGWTTTLLIAAAALVLSTVVGIVFALARRSRILPLRYFAKVYVEAIRATPLLVQILIFFYVVADAVGMENRYVAGVLTLSCFAGAYIAEIIRAGIESVGRTQIESAMAIGLTRSQTYRHVIAPQALRVVLPPLAGQFVSLIKDSSLLSIIGVSELTLNAQNVASYTFSNFESYLILAAGYLLLTLPISLWTRWLEGRIRFET